MRILFGARPVLAGVVEIQFHLASIGVGEPAEFQVDENQAS
jgi:hypothetical protein